MFVTFTMRMMHPLISVSVPVYIWFILVIELQFKFTFLSYFPNYFQKHDDESLKAFCMRIFAKRPFEPIATYRRTIKRMMERWLQFEMWREKCKPYVDLDALLNFNKYNVVINLLLNLISWFLVLYSCNIKIEHEI